MKKVHNTKRKSEEMIDTLQTTTLRDTNTSADIFPALTGSTTMGSNSLDWLEIMEHEAEIENQQKKCQMNNFHEKNSMTPAVEGSGNLCDRRSDGVCSSVLHIGASIINTDAESYGNRKLGNNTPPQETKSWSEFKELKNKKIIKEVASDAEQEKEETTEQNTNIIEAALPLEILEVQINVPSEEPAAPANQKPSIALTTDLNKEFSALIPPAINNEKSNQNDNKILNNQQMPIDSGIEDISLTEADKGFTTVTYNKKKKKTDKKDRREQLGPYKKYKILTQ
ncbi:43627_t:CDS:2 [Gigaspora margarita]|uniref:43627_t:CDS:1 n=1 Tax=Gigaspora margarita TaxID=4874 RepID=A0ABM8VXG1_GIGMA|nr:43627_t:CDS:2 [Gigaspora margarita]